MFDPYSLVYHADTHEYSILRLANIQYADEKGKARADPQHLESVRLMSDGSNCGDEASIDGDRTSPHQVSEDLYVFLHDFYLLLPLTLSRVTSVAAGKVEITSDVEDGGEDDIMSPDCQDPSLAQTYLGLPVLP